MRAYEKDFIDFISIADYVDNHHSSCFRAYNLYREALAHKAQLDKLTKDTSIIPDPVLWESLRTSRASSVASTNKPAAASESQPQSCVGDKYCKDGWGWLEPLRQLGRMERQRLQLQVPMNKEPSLALIW